MASPIRGNQKPTKEDVARAIALANQGLGPEAIQARLVDGGMDPDIALHATQSVDKWLRAESFEMLAKGSTPDAAVLYLSGKGMSLYTAHEIVQEHLTRLQSMWPDVGWRVVGGFLVLISYLLHPHFGFGTCALTIFGLRLVLEGRDAARW